MALWSEFCGSSYTARSKAFAADRSVNVYAETREIPGSPKQTTLYGTPGLNYQTALDGRCRNWFTQDGRTWVVCGTKLYEQNSGSDYTVIGTVPDDGRMVSFVSNGLGGDQLGVIGGGELNVLDLVSGTYETVTLPFSNPVMGVFQDGYVLINERDTPIVWFSNLENMTVFDALDFVTRSGTSDNVVGLGVSQDRIWFFGSKTTTLYYDSGDADTPFLPYAGTTTQNGLASAQLLAVYRDNFFWVSAGQRGTYRVLSGTAPAAQSISTHPIETWLTNSTSLDNATMLLYEQEGHIFVAITSPTAQDEIKTQVYDATEKTFPWHCRAGLDTTTGQYTQWRAQGSTVVGGTVYVGDYSNGNVYTLDLDTYTDNGVTIKRARRAPYLGAENQWVFVDEFELGTQPAVGEVSATSASASSVPEVELMISRDLAQTWEYAGAMPLGRIGEYDTKTAWIMLGRSRADRLAFEVFQTAPVKTVWGPGAWLRLSPGTGQL
jgi:hypothetical protein